jgi:hypothetical protein
MTLELNTKHRNIARIALILLCQVVYVFVELVAE